MARYHFEVDDDAFPADAYSTTDYDGVAWRVLGWHTEPDGETEWSGYEVRTGHVVLVMIGDDRHFLYDPEDITPIARDDYCGVCGQIGCTHDGLERG